MPKKKKKPKIISYKGFRVFPTDASKNELRTSLEHEKISRVGESVRRTGQCPICWERDHKGHGITCGEAYCVHAWLFPKIKNPHPPPKTVIRQMRESQF